MRRDRSVRYVHHGCCMSGSTSTCCIAGWLTVRLCRQQRGGVRDATRANPRRDAVRFPGGVSRHWEQHAWLRRHPHTVCGGVAAAVCGLRVRACVPTSDGGHESPHNKGQGTSPRLPLPSHHARPYVRSIHAGMHRPVFTGARHHEESRHTTCPPHGCSRRLRPRCDG